MGISGPRLARLQPWTWRQLAPREEDVRMRFTEVMVEAIALASEAIKGEKKRKGD